MEFAQYYSNAEPVIYQVVSNLNLGNRCLLNIRDYDSHQGWEYIDIEPRQKAKSIKRIQKVAVFSSTEF